MPAKWKISIIFDAPRAGWTETFYSNDSSIDAVIQPTRNVCGVRNRLLGKGVTIDFFRISSIEPPRVSSLFAITLAPDSVAGTLLSDVPWNGPLARLTDVTGKYQRSTQIRGTPDVWLQRRDDTLKFDLDGIPGLKNGFDAWVQSLRANRFMFRARDGEGVNGAEVNITGFGTGGPGMTNITVTSAVAGAVGEYLTFSGITGDGAEVLNNGRHRIKSVAAGLITLHTQVPSGKNPSGWTGGKARPSKTDYFQVHTGSMRRAGDRDTGRPFGLRRGRRPKQKKSATILAAPVLTFSGPATPQG